MKREIQIPEMGESITEVTIGTIFKPSGSQVRLDEELVEIETDKVNQALYAPTEGVVTFFVSQGSKARVGEVIGFVEEQKEEAPQKKAPITATIQGEKERSTSTPKKEEGERETATKLSSVRKAIAARMLQVTHETAMLTTFNEVDMSSVIALRERYKEEFMTKWHVKLGFMSFFVKACSLSLQEFPQVNSYIDGEFLKRRNYIDISVAVSTDRGVVVPVLRDCAHCTFAQIEEKIADFAARARDNKLSMHELVGGGFTITNGGVFGSLLSTPLLNPPQCAILGMHAITKRPVVVDDTVVVRPMMYLALSYDHRVIDGKDAVLFLKNIKEYIEDPDRIALDL